MLDTNGGDALLNGKSGECNHKLQGTTTPLPLTLDIEVGFGCQGTQEESRAN